MKSLRVYEALEEINLNNFLLSERLSTSGKKENNEDRIIPLKLISSNSPSAETVSYTHLTLPTKA